MKHDILEGRLRPTFFTLFASALGGTLISTIYATVDIICVGQHSGPDATAAISCVNPLWSIMIGPGLLAGVGGSVLMTNRRATGKEGSARGYLTAGMALAAVLSLIVTVVLVSFPRELIGFFGAEGQVLEYGVTYMRPVALSAFTFTLASALSAYMRNSGEAFTPTVATAIGGVVNMVLDVYLVFGLDLGVFGEKRAELGGRRLVVRGYDRRLAARDGRKYVDRRIVVHLRKLARKDDVSVKDGTRFVRDRFGHVIAFDKHRVKRSDGAFRRIARTLH